MSLEENESISYLSESTFEPFIYDGIVSLTEASSEMKRIRILRDTGAAQSFILQSALPFSEQSSCGSSVLVQVIDLTVIKAPLHQVFLHSGIISRNVKLALRAQLPVKDVSLILGNDLAGDKVFYLPEVIDTPVASDVDVLCEEFPDVFGTCVVTRSQACTFRDTVDLSDNFLCADNFNSVKKGEYTVDVEVCALPNVDLPIGKPMFIEAQRTDLTLSHCIKAAV